MDSKIFQHSLLEYARRRRKQAAEHLPGGPTFLCYQVCVPVLLSILLWFLFDAWFIPALVFSFLIGRLFFKSKTLGDFINLQADNTYSLGLVINLDLDLVSLGEQLGKGELKDAIERSSKWRVSINILSSSHGSLIVHVSQSGTVDDQSTHNILPMIKAGTKSYWANKGEPMIRIGFSSGMLVGELREPKNTGLLSGDIEEVTDSFAVPLVPLFLELLVLQLESVTYANVNKELNTPHLVDGLSKFGFQVSYPVSHSGSNCALWLNRQQEEGRMKVSVFVRSFLQHSKSQSVLRYIAHRIPLVELYGCLERLFFDSYESNIEWREVRDKADILRAMLHETVWFWRMFRRKAIKRGLYSSLGIKYGDHCTLEQATLLLEKAHLYKYFAEKMDNRIRERALNTGEKIEWDGSLEQHFNLKCCVYLRRPLCGRGWRYILMTNHRLIMEPIEALWDKSQTISVDLTDVVEIRQKRTFSILGFKTYQVGNHRVRDVLNSLFL